MLLPLSLRKGIFIAGLTCISAAAHAQSKAPKIQLGKITVAQKSESGKITKAEILAEPTLRCEGCEIIGFKASLTLNKEENTHGEARLFGPFDSNGANLPQQLITLIKDHEPGATIWLDDITVKFKGKTQKAASIILKY